jgi:hypothetical protein
MLQIFLKVVGIHISVDKTHTLDTLFSFPLLLLFPGLQYCFKKCHVLFACVRQTNVKLMVNSGLPNIYII